jgi:enoyl-CoA hydratase/carnithine racemase
VRVLTLNRPDRRNALDPALVAGLTRALDAAESDPAVGALVLTGAGTAFCAGADLAHLDELARADRAPTGFIADISGLVRRFETSPLGIVAAVNGAAVAGGLELALGCDVVVAAESARIGDGHVRNGLLPGGGSSVRLPRKVGVSWARWLLLSGELVPARVLLPTGWLRQVVPDEALLAAAIAAAASLAERAGPPQARLKALLVELDELSPSAGLEHEVRTFDAHWHDYDVIGGVRAFLGRPAPTGAAL